MNGLYITGTDTGVGKTHVMASAIRQLRRQGVRVGAYKPACSGAREELDEGEHRWDDIERLYLALGREFPRDLICPQTFLAPLAPPVAAVLEQRQVDPVRLRTGVWDWVAYARGGRPIDLLLVEGAGGFLSPISHIDTNANLAVDLGFPVVIVAPNRLGTINQTLLTIEAVRSRGLRVAGVVLNQISPEQDRSCETNGEEIERFSSVPLIGTLDWEPSLAHDQNTLNDTVSAAPEISF